MRPEMTAEEEVVYDITKFRTQGNSLTMNPAVFFSSNAQGSAEA